MCGCGCHLVAAKAEADREAAEIARDQAQQTGAPVEAGRTLPGSGREARRAEPSYTQMAREMWAALTGQVRQI